MADVSALLKKSTLRNERCARKRIMMPDSDPRDGFFYVPLTPITAGLGGSVGRASNDDQEVAGSTSAGSVTFFRGDLIMKYFLRLFPYADSRRTVVSFWRKNVRSTG